MASWGRRWLWPCLAALAALGAGCVDLKRPDGRVGLNDAAADRPSMIDAPADTRPQPDGGPDAAPNPEDDPRADAAGADGVAADSARAVDAAGDTAVDARPADAASPDVAPAACTPVFGDDFESGTLDAWDKSYTVLPAVTGTGAIAGARSLSTRLGTENAAGRTFAATSRLALQFAVDLTGMTTSGSIPNVAAVRGNGLDYNPIAVYFGRDADGPVISVRANLSSSTFERISFAPLPASRVTVRIEWQAGGVARVFIDGAPFWTSPTLSNGGVRVDELRVGNTGGAGSGTVLFDDVLLEECP